MDENENSTNLNYDELLEKLKAAEIENRKLLRQLRSNDKLVETYKLNMTTQENFYRIMQSDKLKQDRNMQQLLINCPDIIFLLDHKKQYLLGSKSAAVFMNLDDDTILTGRALSSITNRYLEKDLGDELVSAIDEVTEKGVQYSLSFEANSTNRQYEVTVQSFPDDVNELGGYLILMHDSTDLVEALDMAKKASRAKSDFLANMSHEMRTPMNTIIGMSHIAKSSDDPSRKDYCLNKIENASNHLLGVINDILDMSKIEANKFELSISEFDLEKMIMKVTNVINFRVEEMQQQFFVGIDNDIPTIISADEQRLSQVITNLLSNAVKFTPEGGNITLNVHKKSQEKNSCELLIEVSDTGIGISPEQQSRLFASFEQAEAGISRKYGGTGLGLAISKSIVNMMDGEIWVESVFGEGSTFAFTVKVGCKSSDQKSKYSNKTINWKNIKIMAIDESLDVCEFFTQVATRLGVRCETVASEKQALQAIDENGNFDIYFIDAQINGLETAKEIKQIAPEATVVLMTSSADWGDLEVEAKEIGIERFMQKPLFASSIVDCINEALGNETDIEEIDTSLSNKDYTGYHILLAEDIEINREILTTILEPTKIMIDCAENGVEAVEKFEANPDLYHVIFMDIQMPELDGYAATKKIRASNHDRAKTIPIIAMTANVFKEDVDHSLDAGMNAHIGKPIDIDDVIEMLEKYLYIKK